MSFEPDHHSWMTYIKVSEVLQIRVEGDTGKPRPEALNLCLPCLVSCP